MRAFISLTWTEAKLFLREPAATFFTLGFPVLLLVAFGAIFGNEPGSAPGNVGYATYALPGYIALTIGALSLLSIPMSLATQRDQGILRRYRVTPLRPIVVLGAHAAVNGIMLLASTGLLLTLAWLVYGVPLPSHPLLGLGSLLLAGGSFFAPGFLLGALLSTARSAQAVGMGVYFPMLFLSGAAVPQFLFPDWLQQVSLALPLTHVTRILHDAMLYGGWNIRSCIVLLAMGGVSGILAAFTFRWS